MIMGQINADREAVISLVLRSASREEVTIEAVIGTGFSDYLTIPKSLVASLKIPFREAVEFTLADGNSVAFETYALTVIWNGRERSILVLASEGGPLAGMSLLYGYRLVMDVVDGGGVTIEAHL